MSLLTENSQPNRVTTTIRIFHYLLNDVETMDFEQLGIFIVIQAGVIKRFTFEST